MAAVAVKKGTRKVYPFSEVRTGTWGLESGLISHFTKDRERVSREQVEQMYLVRTGDKNVVRLLLKSTDYEGMYHELYD